MRRLQVGFFLVLSIRLNLFFDYSQLSNSRYLAKAEKPERIQANFQLILENWQEAIWRETVLLYTAQLPPRRFSGLLKQASQLGSLAAQLALDCLREYPRPEKLDAQLQQELEGLKQVVTHAKYQTLEALLAAQDWKKADQETYRLMITTVGKEEGQWFKREELLNFPCEDLLAIDGLWRKYSQGRYGFSVQKEIYVKCGAKLDGNYPGDTIWEKFGEEVGWRVNGSWVRYDDLNWGGMGVPGHLPLWRYLELVVFRLPFVGRVYVRCHFSSLASRLVKCNP